MRNRRSPVVDNVLKEWSIVRKPEKNKIVRTHHIELENDQSFVRLMHRRPEEGKWGERSDEATTQPEA
jgi:hypothetical protein